MAISPQTARHSREFKEERRLRFEVLCDPGNAVAEAYGLTYTFSTGFRELYLGFGINLAEYNGDDSWRLPMPARFVLDSEKVIRYAKADPDYMIRPEPEETIEFVRELLAGQATARAIDEDARSGGDRREGDRRSHADRRQEPADIDFPDRRTGEDRRKGKRRSGENRRKGE